MGAQLEISRRELRLNLNLQPRTIAIVPRRRRMNFDLAWQVELGESPQTLTQDIYFDTELMLVAGMLVVPPAAAAEIRTPRRDAMRRSTENRLHPGAHIAGLLFLHLSFDLFPTKDKG